MPPTTVLTSGSPTTRRTPTPPPAAGQVTLAQDELTRRFTREKDQGRRAGVRELLAQLGFDNARALSDFVSTQAVFDLIGADPATDDAQTILDWLRRPKADGKHRLRIKRRDAVAACRRFRTVTQVEPALALLEATATSAPSRKGKPASRGARPRLRTAFRLYLTGNPPADHAADHEEKIP